MDQLSDNELAILELLVAMPRNSFPPLASSVARRLSLLGFAVYDQGRWFVTAKGVEITDRHIH